MEAVRREWEQWGRSEKQLLAALLLSLIFHALFFGVPLLTGLLDWVQTEPEKPTWVEVLPETSPRERRMVQTEKLEKQKEAPQKAFAGEQNQIADRETVSRDQQIQAPGGRPQQAARKAQTAPSALSQFGMPLPPSAPQAQQADSRDYAAPSARAFDYLPSVKEGERTVLNTKEFVYYGYFQRIRKRLDMAWNKVLREKLTRFYRSGRQLASMDHITRVLVILNTGGEITKVQMLSESGTEELDDSAVKAFNSAGPFPNPPKGLIDGEGEVKIPWDFVISIR